MTNEIVIRMDDVALIYAAGVAQIGPSDAPVVAQPRINTANVVVGEGDGYVDVLVSLSAPSASIVTVDCSTFSGTAFSGGNDYVFLSGTLGFLPGETTKTVRVTLLEDNNSEWPENFYLGLSNPTNATLGNGVSTITIIDNDTVLANPSLYVQDLNVDEKDGTAAFVVTLGRLLGQSSNGRITVDYVTVNGTALAGSDYEARSGTLVFEPGQSVKTVFVPIIDDALNEGVERFSLSLSNAVGAVIADAAGVAQIGPSDAPVVAQPRINASNQVVGEGDGYVDVVVSLSAPSASVVTVHYATVNDTAYAVYGGDYNYSSGTLSFLAGETTKTVRIALYEDGNVEWPETFYLNLSSPTNATLGNDWGGITIIDNDTVLANPSQIGRAHV